MITSTANERVKLARSLLTESKARRKAGALALEGTRLVADALSAGAEPDFILYNPEQWTPDSLPVAVAPDRLLPTMPDVFRTVSTTEHPQGVIGVFPMPNARLPEHPHRVLILDALRDPGNAGTILRTAAAANVEVVIFAPGCVDATNDKVLRGAMGAHFRIAWREWAWHQIVTFCAETTLYLADMTGDIAFDQVDWRAPWSLIVGGEAEGASPDAESASAQRIHIPMSSGAESLNAAVAAGILMFQAFRTVN